MRTSGAHRSAGAGERATPAHRTSPPGRATARVGDESVVGEPEQGQVGQRAQAAQDESGSSKSLCGRLLEEPELGREASHGRRDGQRAPLQATESAAAAFVQQVGQAGRRDVDREQIQCDPSRRGWPGARPG